MKRKILRYNLTNGAKVLGKVYNLTQLSARFQIWCRRKGCTDEESLAVWVNDNPLAINAYFSNSGRHAVAAYNGFKKIEPCRIIDLRKES